jgi:hypothetical protein
MVFNAWLIKRPLPNYGKNFKKRKEAVNVGFWRCWAKLSTEIDKEHLGGKLEQ